MNAWEIEEVADSLVDSVLARCEQTMTPEQTVDFLMYMRDLVELAVRVALVEVQKTSN
jgi:hypothetical protein